MFTQTPNLSVGEVMVDINKIPIVGEDAILKISLEEMGRTGLGIVCVVNRNKKLLGIITDGDIRRKLLKVQKPFSAFFVDNVIDHAIINPITIYPNVLLKDAVELMEEKQIWDLPVIDCNGILLGLLHLHQAVKIILGQNNVYR